MNALSDIASAADVKTLVDAFYQKVNQDELLAPIFNEVAQVDWLHHLPTIYRFWESMLLGTGTYGGAPFPKHAVLPIEQKHFERWLSLFVATVNEKFAGAKSEEAKWRGDLHRRHICAADGSLDRRAGASAGESAIRDELSPDKASASPGK